MLNKLHLNKLSIRIFIINISCLYSRVSHGQLSPNWTQEILDSVGNLNANIQGNIARLNQQIADTLKGRLANVDRLNQDIAKRIGNNHIFYFHFPQKNSPFIFIFH